MKAFFWKSDIYCVVLSVANITDFILKIMSYIIFPLTNLLKNNLSSSVIVCGNNELILKAYFLNKN